MDAEIQCGGVSIPLYYAHPRTGRPLMIHTPTGIKTFQTCPRKFYREKVKRDIPFRPSATAEAGIKLHQQFELACAGVADFPQGYLHYAKYLAAITSAYRTVQVEKRIALDKGLKPCSWTQAPWLRGTADAVFTSTDGREVMIIDWKTGKRYPWQLQMDIYALWAFQAIPSATRVTTMFEWVKEYARDTTRYARSDVAELARRVVEACEEIDRAHAEDSWPARSSGLCAKHCDVTDCEHNGRYMPGIPPSEVPF